MAKIVSNAALVLVAVLLIAGCGSSSQPSAVTPSQEEESYAEAEEATYSEEETEEEVGGPLEYVGNITATDEEGMTFSDSYSVGPIMYGYDETPPEEVLEACYLTTPAAVASTVFARGELTIKYEGGSLPSPFDLLLGGMVIALDENENNVAGIAVEVEGEWHCSRVEQSVSAEFQPGESQTFSFWVVVPGMLNNARPRISPSEYSEWHFAFADPFKYLNDVRVVGPGVGNCEELGTPAKFLLLYNRSGSC